MFAIGRPRWISSSCGRTWASADQIVVAIALTRIPGPSGLIYAVDLVGAALGSLLVLPVLTAFDVSSASLFCGAVAACSAACFHRYSDTGRQTLNVWLAAGLTCLAVANSLSPEGLRVIYSKGQTVKPESVIAEFWSIHGRVVVMPMETGRPWFWGAGLGAFKYQVVKLSVGIEESRDVGLSPINRLCQPIVYSPQAAEAAGSALSKAQ